MKIVHRISVASTPSVRAQLNSMGIQVNDSGMATFKVSEEDGLWADIKKFLTEVDYVDIVDTIFSKAEISAADHFEIVPGWHHGYPQPRDDVFGFRERTYDLQHYCKLCGVGLIQDSPFQMVGEPKWGRRNIMQLNWIFDEYFVPPEIWEEVFRPREIGFREVVGSKGSALKTVVQLVIEKEVCIDPNGFTLECCVDCRSTKYTPSMRGAFPALAGEFPGPIAKTQQYFGSGASASKRVLVSKNLALTISDKLNGVSLRPVKNVSIGTGGN